MVEDDDAYCPNCNQPFPTIPYRLARIQMLASVE